MSSAKKEEYWLFNGDENRYQKSAKLTADEAIDHNDVFFRHKSNYRWVKAASLHFTDAVKKHIASLRSICETFPGADGKRKDFYCICGRVIEDDIHIKAEEYNKLSPEDKFLINNRN